MSTHVISAGAQPCNLLHHQKLAGTRLQMVLMMVFGLMHMFRLSSFHLPWKTKRRRHMKHCRCYRCEIGQNSRGHRDEGDRPDIQQHSSRAGGLVADGRYCQPALFSHPQDTWLDRVSLSCCWSLGSVQQPVHKHASQDILAKQTPGVVLAYAWIHLQGAVKIRTRPAAAAVAKR